MNKVYHENPPLLIIKLDLERKNDISWQLRSKKEDYSVYLALFVPNLLIAEQKEALQLICWAQQVALQENLFKKTSPLIFEREPQPWLRYNREIAMSPDHLGVVFEDVPRKFSEEKYAERLALVAEEMTFIVACEIQKEGISEVTCSFSFEKSSTAPDTPPQVFTNTLEKIRKKYKIRISRARLFRRITGTPPLPLHT